MEASSGKRTRGGLSIAKKSSGVQLKERSNNGGMEAQFCNRLGCHGKINHTIVSSNRHTSSTLLSTKTSSGKAIVGSSARTSSSIATISKLPLKSYRKETFSSLLKINSVKAKGSSSKIRMIEIGCSSSSSSSSSSGRPNKKVQESASGLSSSCNTRRFSLRSGRCNSAQDVVPSGTTSTINVNKRKDVLRKPNPVVETKASLRVRTTNGQTSSTIGRSPASNPSNANSISDSTRTRTQRLTNINILPPTSWDVPMPEPSFVRNSCTRTSHRLLGESSSRVLNSNPVPNGSSSSRTFRSSPEVLWTHENLDQSEGITREQLIAMEAQSFHDGMSSYDQHRDMRLDIDNMSYEELLALEEKMGNVSTAIAKEHISKHLRKSIYADTMGCDDNHDDTKCSICQEDYEIGEEIGGLDCNHLYHVECIHQWLQVKKWCPICKAEASPIPSSL